LFALNFTEFFGFLTKLAVLDYKISSGADAFDDFFLKNSAVVAHSFGFLFFLPAMWLFLKNAVVL
jgi:hypothetical protein